MPATDRGRLMAKLADLIEENKELLASIDAWDNGECPATCSSTDPRIGLTAALYREYHQLTHMQENRT